MSNEQPLPVVLVGARGHGRWHLRNLRRLAARGTVTLAGVCELRPLSAEELGEGLGSPEQGSDLGELLERTGARIVIICTPIHTHADLALTAAKAGAHILLEKPPAPSLAEFRRMTDGIAAAGVACQIGFQSLGSHAVPWIRATLAGGAIGRIRGFGAAGAWVREEAYWQRAPWGGLRRTPDGRDVVDGVLTNPLAHAVATALRLAEADRETDIAGVGLELYRVNDIAADDTSSARMTTTDGTPVVTAVTLAAEQPGEPYVEVHGSTGRITFWYKQDRVLLERDGAEPEYSTYDRTDLLENLIAHLRDADVPLLVPPERTGGFMRLVEAVRTAPEPAALPASAWHSEPAEHGPRRVLDGIDALTAAGARQLALYSELGASWAGSTTR
ncbi:Gfo/Idh/MocA family oxidoreductase [Streptomyces sp. XM4011]|uniref:Gfo/Idh/MocA family protein n=1 Tax=Streptomyces TaxID=1883 RepID=UPI001FF8A004|nr:Gfo/Idh/MocA family oxidoreductase [Streptomyces sp. XM4011]MCK1813585.1 Gfo/Idh/MocA family oxidoreductase [Streptomyces sp. XM4011]